MLNNRGFDIYHKMSGYFDIVITVKCYKKAAHTIHPRSFDYFTTEQL